MARYHQGTFTPKNPGKYIGTNQIVYRSSWEKKVFQYFDENVSITQWGSEILKIPYKNPITKQQTIYIPDLWVKYVDKNQNQRIEIIEIKPIRETLIEFAKTKKDQYAIAVNYAKWQAAQIWCSKNGISFRVLTEKDIFGVAK